MRPENPRAGKNGKPVKYESPTGSEVILDVHPRMLDQVRHGDSDLFVTEGMKKADTLTSRGLPTIGLTGVFNFARDGELLACWDYIRLQGRTVNIVYDADVMVNPSVQLALRRLVESLEDRGATVQVVYLPDLGGENGSKTGVDDYLVAGHSVAELKMLARTFDPGDIASIRLSGDAGLRDAVEAAWASWWEYDWNRLTGTKDRPHWMRGHTCRDVEKAAVDTATSSGVVVEDGIFFRLDLRTWTSLAASSKPTVIKAVANLEAEGRLRRVRDERPEGKGEGYVLLTASTPRSNLYHVGETKAREGLSRGGCHHPGKALSAPRLRWGKPTFDRDGDVVHRGYIRRLGKHNGAILDYLESVGGSADAGEIAEALGKRRRNLKSRNFPRLEYLGIIEISDQAEIVSLAPDWLSALEREREITQEIADSRLQHQRHRQEREAYRARHDNPADASPTVSDMDKAREERERRHRAEDEQPVSYLAAAMRIYLHKSPHHAEQPANWLTTTMWADGWLDTNPSPAESKAALEEELGGRVFIERITREEMAV